MQKENVISLFFFFQDKFECVRQLVDNVLE